MSSAPGIPARARAVITPSSSSAAASAPFSGVAGGGSSDKKPPAAAAKNSAGTAGRPVHPAVLTTFGPGRGSGSSELSAWAYLTRPRPRGGGGGRSGGRRAEEQQEEEDALPNLVTAHSNSVRVYTILPHAGTLALISVYDNLAGTICSLDVIKSGTGRGRRGGFDDDDFDVERDDASDDDDEGGRTRDGLVLGFAGRPRLSLVYPSASMHGGAGGVLLASSIIDLTPALVERSLGSTSALEEDLIVAVTDADGDDDDPCVAAVLGGGVAIASFSLPRARRPVEEDGGPSDRPIAGGGGGTWWRVASEPYVLPLSALAARARDLGGGGGDAPLSAAAAGTANPNDPRGGRRGHPAASAAVGSGPSASHGFGDVVDVAYLRGYAEPTLVVLHSDPRRGGGRAWAGRMGRTAEVPVAGGGGDSKTKKMSSEDDMQTGDDDEDEEGVATVPTGTKHGLTLTCASLSVGQRRSVVLWSLPGSMPADAWKLVALPRDGVLVWGVNTAVNVGMGGGIRCALATNGFARIGCPTSLLPGVAGGGGRGRGGGGFRGLESNPSPLPKLAVQLDGARVAFVSDSVAMVCLGNGALHALELHGGDRVDGDEATARFMSLRPLGHRVGGLGVASNLSVLDAAGGRHGGAVRRYLAAVAESGDGEAYKDPKDEEGGNDGSTRRAGDGEALGLAFVASRMGDCTLLAYATDGHVRLSAGAGGIAGKRKGTEEDEELARKQPKLEDAGEDAVASGNGGDEDDNDDEDDNNKGRNLAELTEEEILRREEEELYRDEDEDDQIAAPSVVSASHGDSDEDNQLKSDSDSISVSEAPSGIGGRRCRVAQTLTRFRAIRALDSLTGLGPLGGGCHGPAATCPPLHEGGDATSFAAAAASSPVDAGGISSPFSDGFSSAARHYVAPCGYGDSGGLAVLTSPGRDGAGTGSALCESDLCGAAEGATFGLREFDLVLLGRGDGRGCIVLRGSVREEGEGGGGDGGRVEGFEELDAGVPKEKGDVADDMEVEGGLPRLNDAADVLRSTTLLAASDFCSPMGQFAVLIVCEPPFENGEGQYSVVVMSGDRQSDGSKGLKEGSIGLHIDHIHSIPKSQHGSDARGALSSITPMAMAPPSDGGFARVTFGCVWGSGDASLFSVVPLDRETSPSGRMNFEVWESIILGDGGEGEGTGFYDSQKIVAMDILLLPGHVFNRSPLDFTKSSFVGKREEAASPDQTLSFPPDRISMHGTWSGNTRLVGDSLVAAVCRRSGLLQIYPSDDMLSPIWEAHGCSHGASVLRRAPPVSPIRRPSFHEAEAAEIRLFVAGPSLRSHLAESASSPEGVELDTWMLRSLCLVVDNTLGDLHLYSANRDGSGCLQFSRVPLSHSTRPSEESVRHRAKLRRKGIAPPPPASPPPGFRPSRLHRFRGVSKQDGLFASTPRPLWFVSERGAMTVVSHKLRHVAPAGGRAVPVSGFCARMPKSFQNAKNGFITVHERIGRVGSQRLTLYNGLWDVFARHGILPGGGISLLKVPLGVTVRHIEFVDDASISSTSRPVYAMLISREMESDQSLLNDDGLTPTERRRIREEREAARTRKQVEADLGGFDVEQEWVEEIERENCFAIDSGLGLAPPIPDRKYEVWLVDASRQWEVLDKHELGKYEHGTALKVMYLSAVVEDSDEIPERSLFVGVGTSVIDQDGEDLASKGRVLLFQIKKSKKRAMGNMINPPLELALQSEKDMALGPVTSLSTLRSDDVYRVVVGAGAEVTVEQWGSGKLTQVGFYHAHMHVQEIVLFKTFFLLSDAYDSMHFLVWRESDKSLTLLAKDYEPTQVFAAGLISRGGAMSFVSHDDRQNLSFLQYAPTDAAARGGNKLVCRSDFHLGSQTTSLRSHWCHSSLLFNSCTLQSTLAALKQQDTLFGRLEDDRRFGCNFGTCDGGFGSVVPLSEPIYWRLTALQSVMSNALESNCALSHRAWRLYRRSTRRAGCRSNDRKKGVIDGDMVMKFVDLPLSEQEDLASSIGSTVGLIMDNLLELGCAASII